jgi:hypothetical protein
MPKAEPGPRGDPDRSRGSVRKTSSQVDSAFLSGDTSRGRCRPLGQDRVSQVDRRSEHPGRGQVPDQVDRGTVPPGPYCPSRTARPRVSLTSASRSCARAPVVTSRGARGLFRETVPQADDAVLSVGVEDLAQPEGRQPETAQHLERHDRARGSRSARRSSCAAPRSRRRAGTAGRARGGRGPGPWRRRDPGRAGCQPDGRFG